MRGRIVQGVDVVHRRGVAVLRARADLVRPRRDGGEVAGWIMSLSRPGYLGAYGRVGLGRVEDVADQRQDGLREVDLRDSRDNLMRGCVPCLYNWEAH